jgi:hypothetical protein
MENHKMFLLLSVSLLVSTSAQAITCPADCKVTADDGTKYDLSALKGQTLTTTSDNGDVYTMTLCGQTAQTCSKDPSTVINGMAVQKQGSGDGCYVLGVYDTQQMCEWSTSEPGAALSLIMQDGSSTNCMGQDRSLAVELNCPKDKSALVPTSWTAVNPTGTCDYVFKIETCAVCAGGCVGGSGGSGAGTIFLILLLVSFLLYLVVGSMYQYKVGEHRGSDICVSLYPTTFCGYVAAGCKFCMSGCKSSGAEYESFAGTHFLICFLIV